MTLFRRHAAEDRGKAVAHQSGKPTYPELLAAADKVLAEDPGSAMGHHHRGWALSELGRPDEAEAGFSEARRLVPGIMGA